ncbi:MAG TPA: phage holin family protein [Bradyrhizobium sp.]
MLAPSSDLLRAGLALKLSQIKRATRSYLRDRTNQATGTVASYAVAAGLFAASGIFLIAALLVGLAALFRWIELTYGRFQAFGAVGGLLVLIAILCATLAATRLNRPPRHYPSLTSRLRVAIKANPLKQDRSEAMQDVAAALVPMPSPSPRPATVRQVRPLAQPLRDNRQVQAGVILAATLLGWAAMRRKSRKRQSDF